MNSAKSYVWAHFEKIEDQAKVICKDSKKQFKFHKATSSQRSHLENKHRLLDPRRVKASSQNITTSNQSHIHTMLRSKSPLQKEAQMELDKNLVIFMATNEQPFSLVEHKWFKIFCRKMRMIDTRGSMCKD